MINVTRSLLSKIKSPSALRKILSGTPSRSSSRSSSQTFANKKKKRAVFTNGCFDLLHKGHVTYLERARKLGDVLIVALNSDASVRKLKGPERPLNRLADRLEVIAALESVDFVTWFEEETPLDLI